MWDADRYRKMASRLREEALRTTDPVVRDRHLLSATQYDELADFIEGKPRPPISK